MGSLKNCGLQHHNLSQEEAKSSIARCRGVKGTKEKANFLSKAEFPRIRREQESSLNQSCKETVVNNQMGRTREREI